MSNGFFDQNGNWIPQREADAIRKEMVETGQPQKDLTNYKCCKHCNHDAPWGGSETLAADDESHSEPCAHCQTWTTEEFQLTFEAIGFAAPFVVVRRKSDGKKGSLEFTHSPRVYFAWKEDDGNG